MNLKSWFKSNTIRYFRLDEWQNSEHRKDRSHSDRCIGSGSGISARHFGIHIFPDRGFTDYFLCLGVGRQRFGYFRENIEFQTRSAVTHRSRNRTFFIENPINKRYNLLVQHIFSKLSKSSKSLETLPIYVIHTKLELHYGADLIFKSPYFHEARNHLTKDLARDTVMPEVLFDEVRKYNECVKQFLEDFIPNKVRQAFRRIPNLTISEDPNYLPDNSILLPHIVSNLENYLLSDGKNNPELFYENDRLSEGHGIKTLATIPLTLNEPVRRAIEDLKHDNSIVSILHGTPIMSGLWKRRTDLIANGIRLAEAINNKIIFEIERDTYRTRCSECENIV